MNNIVSISTTLFSNKLNIKNQSWLLEILILNMKYKENLIFSDQIYL